MIQIKNSPRVFLNRWPPSRRWKHCVYYDNVSLGCCYSRIPLNNVQVSFESHACDVRQGVFSRKESGDREDGAVKQHLPQFEVNPVPEEESFKRAKGQNEGEDVEREETRLGGYYLGPLWKYD